MFQRKASETQPWGFVLAARVTQENWEIQYPTPYTSSDQFLTKSSLRKTRESSSHERTVTKWKSCNLSLTTWAAASRQPKSFSRPGESKEGEAGTAPNTPSKWETRNSSTWRQDVGLGSWKGCKFSHSSLPTYLQPGLAVKRGNFMLRTEVFFYSALILWLNTHYLYIPDIQTKVSRRQLTERPQKLPERSLVDYWKIMGC